MLNGEGGRIISGHSVIDSGNIKDYVPSEADVSELCRIFEKNGFSTGELSGISFSITGPAAAFEKFLRAEICEDKDGLPGFVSEGRKVGLELSNEMLPEEVKTFVNAIVFTAPPDFGPGAW